MNLRTLTAVCLIPMLCAADADARKWRDRQGKFQLEAEYAGYREGKVLLRTDDELELSVDLQQLSAEDQAWVAEQRELPDINPFRAPLGSLACRGADRRAELLKKYGGDERSEAAVARALKWIAEHQLPDGGWSFQNSAACACGGHGSVPARNAATAMALLPLLAAGNTHQQGDHQQQVKRGLAFLLLQHEKVEAGGSWHESGGSMYSHGLASQVICEAYQMTGDEMLRPAAQAAVNYIQHAQDPQGGGWRYMPRQPGDTSVTGWQLDALFQAGEAGLTLSDDVLPRAEKFIDSVATQDGAAYGYTTPGAGPATSAIGLLARTQFGADVTRGALAEGMKRLADRGPSTRNMYYNYYATKALFHQQQAEQWATWNRHVRELLLPAQASEGHESGSWHFTGDHGSDRAGRLYNTSLATLILQVYYRHPPR